MITNKMSPVLQLSLRYENLFTPEIKSLYIVDAQEQIWELIIRYEGDLTEIGRTLDMKSYDLGSGFAQVFISKANIGALSDEVQVSYLTRPTKFEYITVGLQNVCAAALATPAGSFNVTGENVLLGVVDSGIDYAHPDFRNEDGTTRIVYLWDQNLPGIPPEGLEGGREFTREEINEALKAESKAAQLQRVPSMDELGHGTAITGIAAGNGRGSVGRINKGVAPGCELIVVKLGVEGKGQEIGLRDVNIMKGISYIMGKAKTLEKPVVILLGCGQSLNSHKGNDVLPIYIDAISKTWACNIVVGTGNEGDRANHVSGQLVEETETNVELLIEDNIRNYGVYITASFGDEFELVIHSPTGETTEALSMLTPNRAYLFDNTAVIMNFSQTVTDISSQEIFIYFQAQGVGVINNGLWRFSLKGKRILEGQYNMWGNIVTQRDNRTRFLIATLDITLTSPSTARTITSVSAYNGQTGQLAVSSGRGYTLNGRIKPEIAAPSVNITVPSSQEGTLYTTFSGSSAAAAFVAGAYVILIAYGFYELGNINAYGEILKAYLIRNARRPAQNIPYPNNRWGYGTLCIEAALNDMREVASQTS